MTRTVNYFSGCVICLVTGAGLFAQEVITPLLGNPGAKKYYSTHQGVKKAAVVDTLELPFFEDFSTTEIEPDPALWSDNTAFINNSYCVNPVTNGVATLDVLDFDGSIYPRATIYPTTFLADQLTSHPLKLAYPAGDSIYFSFMYQARGLGIEPVEEDSLLVDFYAPHDTTWVNVWSTPGTGLHPFMHAMIPVTDERFLAEGFRFRFRNRASLLRNSDQPDKVINTDHWHVDYVRLDRNRFVADTVLRDVAFSSPIGSVLQDLTSFPWAHFEEAYNTALDPAVVARYRNNDTITRNITRSLMIEEPLYNETFSPGNSTAQDLPAMEDTVVEFEYLYPLDFNRGDSAIIRFRASLRTDDFDPKINDTVVYDQVFSDYYAYDDGTPEAGYGLRGQGTRNGSVALKYYAFKEDEIGGVDILFNQLYDSVNLGYYFKLIVWEDNEGIPGNIIWEDENDHTPAYTNTFPGFIRFHFTQPVVVDGTFYVGWRQYNEFMLMAGLDRNNKPSQDVLFYNYRGIWETSLAPGILMLRPFLYDETTGEESPGTITEPLHIYPNPAADQVFIHIPGEDPAVEYMLDLYDAAGRMVDRRAMLKGQMDVSHLPAGIYYMKVYSERTCYHAKMLINR